MSGITAIRMVSSGFLGLLHPLYGLVRRNPSKQRWSSPAGRLSLGRLRRRRRGGGSSGDRSARLEGDI